MFLTASNRIFSSFICLTLSVLLTSATSAQIATSSGSATSDAIKNPTLDCSFSGRCVLNGREYPKEVCYGIYGSCPKEPLAEMATPCESIIEKYHPYNTYVEHADENGLPYWAKPRTTKTKRTHFNPGAAAVQGYSTLARILGDDECLDDTDKEVPPGEGRVKCCKKMLDKGTDPCNWRYELGLCVANGALAAANLPETTGEPQVYAAEADIVCMQQPTTPPHPDAYRDTATGARIDPGPELAKKVVQNAPNPTSVAGLFHGAETLEPKPLSGENRAYKVDPDSDNEHYSRWENPVQVASSKIYLTTPPYAVYDPKDYKPGQEKKLALELFHKTPLEIVRLRNNPPLLGNEAQAFSFGSFGNTGDVDGIMCKLEPATCHLTSHYDREDGIKERYWSGLEFATQVSTPSLKFVDNLQSLFSDSIGQIQNLAGNLFSQVLGSQFGLNININFSDAQGIEVASSNSFIPAQGLTRNQYLRCLNAMMLQTRGNTKEELVRKQAFIKASCPTILLTCLQGQGGYSERRLDFCYQMINQPGERNNPNLSQQNPNAPDGESVSEKLAKGEEVEVASNQHISGTPASAAFINVGGAVSSATNSVSNFLFGSGGPAYTLGQLGPATLDSLNGFANQSSDLLMQQIPGMPSIGGLVGNDGQFFGNAGQLGNVLPRYKRNQYSQIYYPANLYDMRAAMNMFPERDHYSPCATTKNCYVGRSEAPYNLWAPWYTSKDDPGPNTDSEDKFIDNEILEAGDQFTPGGGGMIQTAFGPVSSLATAAQGAISGVVSSAASSLQGAVSGAISTVTAPINNAVSQVNNAISSVQNTVSGVANTVNVVTTAVSNPQSVASNLATSFAGSLTDAAIGMPITNELTGPVFFKADGTAFYPTNPDVKTTFLNQSIYYADDKQEDIFSEELASYLPPAPIEQTIWDELAMEVDEQGGLASDDPKKIQYFVKRVNEEFEKMGMDARVTADIFKPSPVDHFMQPGEDFAGSGFSVNRLLEGIGVSPANASSGLPISVAFPPGISMGSTTSQRDNKDVVRCSGERDVNQIRVDVLEPRYKRFNSHMLQRITYNRWCYADYLDKKRCQPNRVCAPKPCHPRRACWSERCWKNNCSPRPHIKRKPSSEWPVAAVRYDYGDEVYDIAHAKTINYFCPRPHSPLFKPVEGECHFHQKTCVKTTPCKPKGKGETEKQYRDRCTIGPGERMTRAYNCRVYPNGKKYCGYTWAYHPDVKYVLDIWAEKNGGDFYWKAGERHMLDECHHLAAPLPLINKVKLASMKEMDKAGLRVAEGTSFPAFFGTRRPYMAMDNTGLEFGQQPGSLPDLRSSEGAYVALQPANSNNQLTQETTTAFKIIDHLITPPGKRKQDGLALATSAYAALNPGGSVSGGNNASGGNQSSNQCCFGGLGGRTGSACGDHGYHPQMGGMLEVMLMQARMHRWFGHNCLPNTGRLMWMLPEGMAANMLGAQFSAKVSSEDGKSSGMLRSMNWPLASRGWLYHPDRTEQFPYGGGAPSPNVQKGFDSLLALGDKAGGAVMILARGGALPDEKPGMRNLAVVTNVNKDKEYIDVVVTNTGLWPDACGLNSGSGQRLNRRFYKPGKLPEYIEQNLDKLDYPTKSCVMSANALFNCEFGEVDTVEWVHFGEEQNRNQSSSLTPVLTDTTLAASE